MNSRNKRLSPVYLVQTTCTTLTVLCLASGASFHLNQVFPWRASDECAGASPREDLHARLSRFAARKLGNFQVFHRPAIISRRKLRRARPAEELNLTATAVKLRVPSVSCEVTQRKVFLYFTREQRSRLRISREMRPDRNFVANFWLINLLRWNDVPRTSRTFYPKIAILSQF